MFTAQYYQNGKPLYQSSEFGLQFSLLADEVKVDTTLDFDFFNSRLVDNTIKQKYWVNDIEFDVYVSSWWSCYYAICEHGHIQRSSKTFYCSEYGRLINISGTYGRAENVDLLVGAKNDTIAGNLVAQILSQTFEIDRRIKERFAEDREKY